MDSHKRGRIEKHPKRRIIPDEDKRMGSKYSEVDRWTWRMAFYAIYIQIKPIIQYDIAQLWHGRNYMSHSFQKQLGPAHVSIWMIVVV